MRKRRNNTAHNKSLAVLFNAAGKRIYVLLSAVLVVGLLTLSQTRSAHPLRIWRLA